MLSKEEQDFVAYWEKRRSEKRNWFRQLSAGLPFAVVIIVAIFANLLSGWYGRAQMEFFRESGSLIITLLLASLGIVTFMVIFAARHRREMNEQRYQELQRRKSNEISQV